MDSDSDESFEEIKVEEYDCPLPAPPEQETTGQKLKNMLYAFLYPRTNSMYMIEGMTNKFNSLGESDLKSFILGEEFQTKEGAMQKFSKTIWFTYRNNFPGLLNNKEKSDTGWGCMIRVGQMFLAEMLGRFQRHNFKE